jgi:hypothetical protein
MYTSQRPASHRTKLKKLRPAIAHYSIHYGELGILLQAIQEITFAHKNTYYFPAYEIVMDELRDYRFYAADMLHPSEVAVEYIFNAFSNVFFGKNTLQCMNEINQYKNGLSHRPIHTDSIEYEKFTKHLLSKKQELMNKYPVLEGRI